MDLQVLVFCVSVLVHNGLGPFAPPARRAAPPKLKLPAFIPEGGCRPGTNMWLQNGWGFASESGGCEAIGRVYLENEICRDLMWCCARFVNMTSVTCH